MVTRLRGRSAAADGAGGRLWAVAGSSAANELPLLDALVSFLMARSGQALAELSRGAHRAGPWSG